MWIVSILLVFISIIQLMNQASDPPISRQQGEPIAQGMFCLSRARGIENKGNLPTE